MYLNWINQRVHCILFFVLFFLIVQARECQSVRARGNQALWCLWATLQKKKKKEMWTKEEKFLWRRIAYMLWIPGPVHLEACRCEKSWLCVCKTWWVWRKKNNANKKPKQTSKCWKIHPQSAWMGWRAGPPSHRAKSWPTIRCHCRIRGLGDEIWMLIARSVCCSKLFLLFTFLLCTFSDCLPWTSLPAFYTQNTVCIRIVPVIIVKHLHQTACITLSKIVCAPTRQSPQEIFPLLHSIS